jgi:hypothetical protein
MRRCTLAIGLALLAPVAALAAEPALGRLFFTPTQRAALEEARRNNIRGEALAAQAVAKPKTPSPRDVVVNGLLMRDDGMSVIWVNGKAIDNETRDGLRVSPNASRESVVLRDLANGRALRVKVGQRADLLNGRVQENYEARRAAARAEAARAEASTSEPVIATPHRWTRPKDAGPPPADSPSGPTSSAAASTQSASPGAPEMTDKPAAATGVGGADIP